MKKFGMILLAAMLMVSFAFTMALAEEKNTLLVGASIKDITPTEDMYPIEYVGSSMGSYLVSAAETMYVRVIAVSDGEDTSLIICSDTGKGPYGPQFVPLLAEHAGIPEENIFFTTTHCHSVPEIKYAIDMSIDIHDPEVKSLDRWAKLTYEQMIVAIDEAMANMQPATVGIGYTDSYINVNRLRTYVREDGSTYVGQGYNPEGFSDKTLAIIEFDDMNGKPIAFLTNYAMHATVMYGSPDAGWNCAIYTDVPGFVSRNIEKKYEGAVAVWTSGAAGDQNPIVAHGMMSPNPETGKDGMLHFSVVAKELVQYLGETQYADVLRGIDTITAKTSAVDIECGYAGTTIPSDTAENGEFGVQLQLVRIGDIGLFGHGGELYNSLAVNMQEKSSLAHTLVVNNTWSHEEQNIGYHPDDDAIANGSYHDTTVYKPGYVADALVEIMNQLIEETAK